MKKIIILIVTLLSCSSYQVKLLKIDRDFIFENYSTSHFYITPTINNTRNISLNESDIQLEKVLKKERKSLLVYGKEYTLSKIAFNNQQKILNDILEDIKNNKIISYERIQLLSKSLGDGFIIFSTIYNYYINEYEQRHQRMGPNEKGVEVVRNKKSTISGTLAICNLNTGKMMFFVEHDDSQIISDSHTESSCFDGCLFSAVDSIIPGPEALSAYQMSEYLYTDIVKNIPKKGDKIDNILKKDNYFEIKE